MSKTIQVTSTFFDVSDNVDIELIVLALNRLYLDDFFIDHMEDIIGDRILPEITDYSEEYY